MFRVISISIYFILVVAGIGLFRVKALVHNMQMQHAEITKQITQEHATINLLKANFSFLTKPERLRLLSNKYLKLDNINLAQISTEGAAGGAQVALNLDKFHSHSTQKSGKWRYKKVKSSTKTVVVENKNTKKR